MRKLRPVLAFLLLAFPLFGQQSQGDNKSQERALLVFYRPKRFYGSGLTPSVYLNGKQLARLDNGRYFSILVDPGKMKIESSMKHAPTEIDVKAGERVYLEMVILSGNWRGGGRIIPSGSEEAQMEIRKLKPLDKKWIVDEGVTFETK